MTKSAAHLAVMPGDGIGPEITSATLKVLDAVAEKHGLSLSYTHQTIGLEALEQSGTTFPNSVFEVAKSMDGTILGPVSHNVYPPKAEGGLNPSGELRIRLDLFANIRPAKTIDGLEPRGGKDVDLIVVRENTEGFYADRNMFAGGGEFMPTSDVALSVRKVTREGSMRIAEMAFEIAMKRDRKKVTSVHKGNVLRLSDGLYLECCRKVAAKYPEVEYDEKIVDAMAALLVRDASAFDVIVTTNMFGDILSDQATEISGSLGLAASLNAGADYALAQAQHGSAPDIAGQDLANPASLIGSAAMLLDWIGERRGDANFTNAGAAIHAALTETASNPETRTRDLGGTLGCAAFTYAVVAKLRA